MLKWLFGDRSTAAVGEDRVWISDAARRKGLRREVDRIISAGSRVMVVGLTRDSCANLLSELSEYQPLQCETVLECDEVLGRLRGSAKVAVALSGALPGALRPSGELRLEILVYGRSDRRAADDAIVRFANLVRAGARATFHLSLDDPLLRRQSESLKPALARLGLSEDEPIAHALVTKAIARAQSK